MAQSEVAGRRAIGERESGVGAPDLERAAGIGRRPPGLRTADPDLAWDAFLAEFASLVFEVVRWFERDEELAEDCFLFVCEHLRAQGLRRLRRFDESGPASFETWLRAVVRNLCLDWRRHRFGRSRLPRAIARLPELEREAYRCVHLRHLTESETLHTLEALCPALTRARLADALVAVERCLSSRQSFLDLARWRRRDPLRRRPAEDGGVAESEPADERVDLEGEVARREEAERLEAELRRLAPGDRLLVRLRFEQGLDLESIARLTGRESAAVVRRVLRRVLATLRERLGSDAEPRVSVKGG